MSDAGSERGGAGRKTGGFENDNKVRDFSNWERKGPLSPVPGAGAPVRDGGRLREPREGGAPREERGGPSWGEGRSEAGSRPPRREYERSQAPERAPTAAEQDSQWRTSMKPDVSPATPGVSTPTSPSQAEAPKERPRLNLAKRTVSTSEHNESSSTPSDAKASPFGAARPIDTAAREKEVEEKRQLALRLKEEADSKAREEKAAKEAEQRAARAERADRGQATPGSDKISSPTGEQRRPSRPQTGGNSWRDKPKETQDNKQAKENGDAAPKERASFSVLHHEGEEGDADVVDAPANGTIIADKETKPQEPVVVAGETAETTAEVLEDDGWSTVSAKPKNSRRGGGARAIAS